MNKSDLVEVLAEKNVTFKTLRRNCRSVLLSDEGGTCATGEDRTQTFC